MLLFQTIYKSRIFLRTQESPVIKQEDYHGRYESNYAAAQYAGTVRWECQVAEFTKTVFGRIWQQNTQQRPEHPCKTISLCNYAFSLIITSLLSLHRHFSFILLVFQGHFCSFAQKFLIIQQLFILYSHIIVTINS